MANSGKLKPYLTFSHPRPGAKALLFKKAAEANARVLRGKTIAEHREAMLPLADLRVIPPWMRFEAVSCNGIPCEWASQADSRRDKVILYIHGGSWTYGNLKTARAVSVMLSEVSDCRVLTVDYRLSPEFPYPAACEDCMQVYSWLLDNGYEAGSIAFFGDSAGGNLGLSLLHSLKAQGQELPAAVGIASPVTDLTGRSELVKRPPDQLFSLYQGEGHSLLDLYCGQEDRSNPLISPVYGDLTGFPPLLIHVGQDEWLCVDCDVFARKAYDAGVDVALKIWRDMFHDFTIVGVTLKESRQSMVEFGAFFRRHLLGEISLLST